LRNVFVLLKKEYFRFVVDKPAVLLTFVLPAILILIFGSIFGGSGGIQSKIPILFVSNNNQPLAKFLEEKLDSSDAIRLVKTYKKEGEKNERKIDEETAKRFVKTGKYSTALVIPSDFISDTSTSIHLKMYYDPSNQVEYSLIQGIIQKTIFMQLPQLFPALFQKQALKSLNNLKRKKFSSDIAEVVSKYFGVPRDKILESMEINNLKTGKILNNKKNKIDDFISKIIRFESKQLVGLDIANPGVTRAVGGWAMMFLLFSITGAAASFFEEKQEGSLKRLLCMPVKRSQLIWAKYIFSISLGVIQLFVMFLFAQVVFNVDIFSNFGNLMIVIVASAIAAVSFGMLITSVTKSYSQANGIATIFILIMSAIGGSWFPTFLLPEWMQTISHLTINYWSVEAFLQVLWRNAPFSRIALPVFILISTGFVVNFYALVRFRKGNIF